MNNWTVTQVVTFLRDAGFSDFRSLAIALTQETKGDSKQLCSSPEVMVHTSGRVLLYSFNSCGGLEERREGSSSLLSCSWQTMTSIISEMDQLGEFTSKEFFEVTDYPSTTGYMVRRYLMSIGYLQRDGEIYTTGKTRTLPFSC